jgi:hypothetical protein
MGKSEMYDKFKQEWMRADSLQKVINHLQKERRAYGPNTNGADRH